MEINNKDIWRDDKKYCIICGKEYKEDGIHIMHNFICEKCVQEMTLIDVTDKKYDIIREKFKKSLVKDIIELDK